MVNKRLATLSSSLRSNQRRVKQKELLMFPAGPDIIPKGRMKTAANMQREYSKNTMVAMIQEHRKEERTPSIVKLRRVANEVDKMARVL